METGCRSAEILTSVSDEALKNFRKTRLSEFVVKCDSVKDALVDVN